MKIYTSYFGNIKRIEKENPNIVFISIAGKSPIWFNGKENYKKYSILAPKYFWWKEWHSKFNNNLESDESKEWYTLCYYETVLNMLDSKKVLYELQNISNGHDICLLCYETAEKFCHRHIVSKWLQINGIQCKEKEINK